MNPHLFISTDPWGETSLWFGAGPDDPRPELIQFNCSREAAKALWTAVAVDAYVPDYTPEEK